MAVDIPFIISNVIITIVTFILFVFNYLIYKKTTGGSYAYRCWMFATFFMFLYGIIAVSGGFIVAEEELDSSNLNEMFKLVSLSISALGYFYVPLGILYLGSDLEIYNLDQKRIKQLQIVYFSFILTYFTLFLILIFDYYVVEIFRNLFDLIFSLIWIFSFIIYQKFYKEMRKIDIAWSYLFLGLFSLVGQSIATTLRDIGLGIFQYVMILFQGLLGIFLILSFYRLGKMLEAF